MKFLKEIQPVVVRKEDLKFEKEIRFSKRKIWLEAEVPIVRKLTRKERRKIQELLNDKKPKARFRRWKNEVKDFHRVAKNISMQNKLEELRKFSEFKIPNPIPYYVRREGKHRPHGNCRVCIVKPANVQHHMIQIQHGGPDEFWNRIHICNDCHEEIHSWLKTQRVGKGIDDEFKKLNSKGN